MVLFNLWVFGVVNVSLLCLLSVQVKSLEGLRRRDRSSSQVGVQLVLVQIFGEWCCLGRTTESCLFHKFRAP